MKHVIGVLVVCAVVALIVFAGIDQSNDADDYTDCLRTSQAVC